MSDTAKENVDMIISWAFKLVLIIAGFFSSMFIYDIKERTETIGTKVETIEDKVTEIKVEQAGAKQQLKNLELAVFKSNN